MATRGREVDSRFVWPFAIPVVVVALVLLIGALDRITSPGLSSSGAAVVMSTQTATATQEPTATNTPTVTPSPTSIPTSVPTVVPFVTGIEGMLFHQLCEDIQAEDPEAKCPIVVQEEVPMGHRFVAFVDEDGADTGYGLDLDNSIWCEQETECVYLFFMATKYHVSEEYSNLFLRIGTYYIAQINKESKEQVDKFMLCDVPSDFEFTFPYPRVYWQLLRDTYGVSFTEVISNC